MHVSGTSLQRAEVTQPIPAQPGRGHGARGLREKRPETTQPPGRRTPGPGRVLAQSRKALGGRESGAGLLKLQPRGGNGRGGQPPKPPGCAIGRVPGGAKGPGLRAELGFCLQAGELFVSVFLVHACGWTRSPSTALAGCLQRCPHPAETPHPRVGCPRKKSHIFVVWLNLSLTNYTSPRPRRAPLPRDGTTIRRPRPENRASRRPLTSPVRCHLEHCHKYLSNALDVPGTVLGVCYW